MEGAFIISCPFSLALQYFERDFSSALFSILLFLSSDMNSFQVLLSVLKLALRIRLSTRVVQKCSILIRVSGQKNQALLGDTSSLFMVLGRCCRLRKYIVVSKS